MGKEFPMFILSICITGCAIARLDNDHKRAADKYVMDNRYEKLEKLLSDSSDISGDSFLLNSWVKAVESDGNCRVEIFKLLLSKGALLYQSNGKIYINSLGMRSSTFNGSDEQITTSGVSLATAIQLQCPEVAMILRKTSVVEDDLEKQLLSSVLQYGPDPIATTERYEKTYSFLEAELKTLCSSKGEISKSCEMLERLREYKGNSDKKRSAEKRNLHIRTQPKEFLKKHVRPITPCCKLIK